MQYPYATGLGIKKIENWNFYSNTVKNVKAEPADLLKDSSNLLRDLGNGEIPIDNLLILNGLLRSIKRPDLIWN